MPLEWRLNSDVRVCSLVGPRMTIYTMGDLSKGQSFPLESIMEYLCNFEGGSLFLCEKSPSNCTRNSPNPFWGSGRLSVLRLDLFFEGWHEKQAHSRA